MWNQFIQQALLFTPRLGISLLIFLLFWFSGSMVQKVIRRLGEHSDLHRDVLNLLGQTAKIGLILFGAIIALGTIQVDVSALVASLGLTGFALGFAFRDALSNLLAGVLILAYRPFRRNDRIAVAGFEGIVISIDLRYTTLQTEGKKVLIPNSTLFTNAVTVWESGQ